MLRIAIVVLLLGILATLGVSLLYLFKDYGTKPRAMTLLGVRLLLAATLLILIIWGLWTGELQLNAPWQGKY